MLIICSNEAFTSHTNTVIAEKLCHGRDFLGPLSSEASLKRCKVTTFSAFQKTFAKEISSEGTELSYGTTYLPKLSP